MNKKEIEHTLVKFFDTVVIDELLEKLNGMSKDFYIGRCDPDLRFYMDIPSEQKTILALVKIYNFLESKIQSESLKEGFKSWCREVFVTLVCRDGEIVSKKFGEFI